MQKSGLWDGSPQERREQNFRPKCRKRTSGTEVDEPKKMNTLFSNTTKVTYEARDLLTPFLYGRTPLAI